MFNITTKLLGYLSGGLGAAALLASAFAGLQTYRLHGAQESLTHVQDSLGRADKYASTIIAIANERTEALKGRDALIADQSASIDRLAEASKANRTNYLAGLQRADQSGKAHEARAAELAKVPVEAPQDRCEAARTLIIKELTDVR